MSALARKESVAPSAKAPVLVATAKTDAALCALAGRLAAAGETVEMAELAATPGEKSEPVAELEIRYGITVGQFAQAQPSSAALYAPGIVVPAVKRTDAELGRQFAGEIGHWERLLASVKPRALIVRQGMPLAATLVAQARGCPLRSLETLPGGLAYWSADARGVFPSTTRSADPALLAARLAKAIVDRPAPFGVSAPRTLMRALAQRRWTTGGFAAALTDAPTLLVVLEAEPSLDIVRHSPDFTDQHVAIVALSRDLPAGARIAVLEHPDMPGRRPSNFYRQLRDLKNTVLLPPGTPVASAIEAATAVAGIAGPALLHAALMDKPVIALGARFPGRGFVNVRWPADIGNMRAEIASALADGDETAAREANLQAIGQFCFVAGGAAELQTPELD